MKNMLLLLFCLFISSSCDALYICNKYTCPLLNGKCGRDNECECVFGYTTIDNIKFGDFHCNYKMKSQVKAFLLEFLIGFGIGHFYIGNKILALVKLLFASMTCFIICQLPSIEKIKSIKICAYYIQMIFGSFLIIWQIVDSVLIGCGVYKDNNGIPLRPW